MLFAIIISALWWYICKQKLSIKYWYRKLFHELVKDDIKLYLKISKIAFLQKLRCTFSIASGNPKFPRHNIKYCVHRYQKQDIVSMLKRWFNIAKCALLPCLTTRFSVWKNFPLKLNNILRYLNVFVNSNCCSLYTHFLWSDIFPPFLKITVLVLDALTFKCRSLV